MRLPLPTPQEIEAALTTMRNGTSAYGQWTRLEQYLEVVHIVIRERMRAYWGWVLSPKCSENIRKARAIADSLWWVTIIEPDGEEWRGLGGGTTLTEAAAVAWINFCIGTSWSESGLSDEKDSKVPRQVPEGWQFELDQAPVGSLASSDIENSCDLPSASEQHVRDTSPWSDRL